MARCSSSTSPFRHIKLALEIDGRLYHNDSEVFETDRWRQNLLILDGWCVLRFTSSMIDERPAEVIAMVREALEMLGRGMTPAELHPKRGGRLPRHA